MVSDFPHDFRSKKNISLHSDRVLAQNFEAVLAVVVKLLGDTIFTKFCHMPENTF